MSVLSEVSFGSCIVPFYNISCLVENVWTVFIWRNMLIYKNINSVSYFSHRNEKNWSFSLSSNTVKNFNIFCKFLVNFGKKERLQKILGIEYWKIESDIWCPMFYSSVYFSPSSVTKSKNVGYHVWPTTKN